MKDLIYILKLQVKVIGYCQEFHVPGLYKSKIKTWTIQIECSKVSGQD